MTLITHVRGGTHAGWRRVNPAPRRWDCPQCGEELSQWWLRCPTCGTSRPKEVQQ